MYDVNGNIISSYRGKSLSILGDSISTFTGYIPSGNANFYNGSNCGVRSVNDTWWKKLIDATGMTLNLNNSWSGSGATSCLSVASAGATRATNLGTDPDIIIVYIGINDFKEEIGIGTYDGSGEFPTSIATFREAYSIMLDRILTTYKHSEVYCCTLPYCERNQPMGFPEANLNGVLLATWNNAIRDLLNLFSVPVIEFAKSGLTYQNMSEYMGDYSATQTGALHPNASGHSLLANMAIKTIDPTNNFRY